jgi:NADPH:quinone reductase-like Zn-dependent oxidoreductase
MQSEKMSRNLLLDREFAFHVQVRKLFMTKYHITPFIEGSWSQFVVLQKQEGGSFVDTPVLAAGDIVPDDFAAQFYVNPVTAYVMMFGTMQNNHLTHVLICLKQRS